jgi:hypothetical protein
MLEFLLPAAAGVVGFARSHLISRLLKTGSDRSRDLLFVLLYPLSLAATVGLLFFSFRIGLVVFVLSLVATIAVPAVRGLRILSVPYVKKI